MLRRLFRTRNSVVLSLPREVLDGLGLAEGKSVSLEFDREHRRMIVTPVDKPITIAGVDKEFVRQVNEFIDLYRPALEELAR